MEGDLDFVMDSASEDESEERPRAQLTRRMSAGNRLPLHQFLRLIAGGRIVEHGSAGTNDALVDALRRGGVIQSERVARAMGVCARDVFVPEEYRPDALIDTPIRIESLEFNISAPHMHATCLEALDLRPGHKFIDVGSGCGVLTACAAYMVGKHGQAVGIDVRRQAVSLSRDNVKTLTQTSREYAATACEAEFEVRDVFLPASKHRGRYDRVHVGASCPPDRLAPLLGLLGPGGGKVVVPVAPSDLRVITRAPDGSLSQRVLSQVRFSELEIPSDSQILLASLKADRRARTAPPSVPSTYAADLAAMRVWDLPLSPGTETSWPRRLSSFFVSCSKASVDSVSDVAESSCPPPSELDTSNLWTDLGQPDTTLVGDGFAVSVHRQDGGEVLRQRCDHFRARCDSGMRDASVSSVQVPEHLSLRGVEAMVEYLYHDRVMDSSDPDAALCTLHAAQYYGVPRLVHQCERTLARVLSRRTAVETAPEELASIAPALLSLADDNGLNHLRAVALDYIIGHHDAAAATPAYATLTRDQVALVAAEACALHARMLSTLRCLGKDNEILPEPVYQ